MTRLELNLWRLLVACVAVAFLAGIFVGRAQAIPHHDRLGYHHCPESAKLTKRCDGTSGSASEGTLAQGNAIRQGIEDDDAGRKHKPHDSTDRETYRLVDDFYGWLHGTDSRSRKLHLRRKRSDECRHLHELYIFRHGLRGPERNDCHGWRRDAHWHERHPAELSTFLGIGV